MRGRILCLLLALASLPPVATAAESPVNISFVETKDLRLYYYNYLSYLEPHVVRTFTNSVAWQKRMFGWVPSEATIILLQDFSDYGGADTHPRGSIDVSVAPKSNAFETVPVTERLYNLMNHEVIHVVQSDIANDEDRRWRRFFLGKVGADRRNPESILYSYLTMPRFTTPRWYAEGTAVFFETWMGGGLGRAQGGYDEMVFRAMVRDNAEFYDPLGLASRGTKIDFQTEANAYLYGTRFFTYLAYTYSPQQVVDLLRRDDGSKRYYTEQFEQVFGISLDKAWQDWIAFEHEFQRRNLTEVRKFPITPERTLAGSAVGSISRMYYDESSGIIYAAFRYPGFVEHVGALNTRDGTLRRLVDIEGAQLYKVSSFAYDAKNGIAFYTNNNYGLRDLMAVDVRTGHARLLIEHARIGEIVVNPIDRSLIGVRHADGLATLVRIPYPYDDWEKIYTFPYGVIPHDLDISPDGRMLAGAVAEVNGNHFQRVWDLGGVLKGNLKPLSQFDFGQSVPESFVFSADGRYLYGSSYYTGVSNIYRYEVATGKVDAMSNAETGFFRPVPLADGRMLVLTYTGQGFVPAIIDPKPLQDLSAITFLGTQLVEKFPVIKTWQVPPPSAVDDEKLLTKKEEPYVPLRSLELVNAYPVVQGYKNTAGIGYHFNVEDPLQFAELGITLAWTPSSSLQSSELGHADVFGRYRSWHGELSWNRSDFYDLFGPVKRSRKGYAAKIGYDWSLIYDPPKRLDVLLDYAYYDQIDTLPYAQNVSTGFTRLMTWEAGLVYTDLRRSLGAVDDEKGVSGKLVYTGNLENGTTTPQYRGELNFGWQLPFAHTSLWLWSAAGYANGDHNSTVANFYFGHFGNNYVDDKSVKRYRDYTSFPGFGIDELSGTSFVRELVELDLPPLVFESAGTPGFYAQWLRPSLFAGELWANPGNSTLRKEYTSLGGQVDFYFNVLHWYNMTLSFGAAVGLQGSQKQGSEWMISLKIM